MSNFRRYSRYTGGLVSKNRSTKDFLILRKALSLEESDGDTFFTISKEIQGRPDLISSAVYGDPDFWWVIYEFNEVQDPLFELGPGQILRIPALDRVLEAIGNLEFR